MGWQVRKRPVGFRPRIQALPPVATRPNERWSTDLCRVWAGRDGWATLVLVIDCHTRELLGWHLSRSGKARTVGSALEPCPDRPLRDAGLRACAALAAIRQRVGLHVSQLHRAGARLRATLGVHHAALPAAKRDARTRDPYVERTMRASASLRDHPARQPCCRGLDTLL